jgi:DNA-binding Lrp family transcriptional regulator
MNAGADQITAYLLFGTDVGHEKETAERLKSVANVTDVYLVYGEYDVLAEIRCADLKSLDLTISTTKKIDGIVRTMPLIVG